MAKYMSILAPRKPLRFWLETFSDLDNPRSPREPTPVEFKNMAYVAAIHGTTLFAYFTFKPNSPDLYNEWNVVSKELGSIDYALTAKIRFVPEITQGENIDATVRVTDGKVVVIAANLNENAQKGAIKLPNSVKLKSKTMNVLFENRTVNVIDGVISDSFAKLARHIYLGKLK